MFNILASYKNSAKVLVTTGLASFLIACGGGGGTSESTSSVTQTTMIQGSAVKGVIENGIVRAYLVEPQAGVMTKADQYIGDAVRTDALGAYQLTLPGDFNNQTMIIEMTADAQTRMTCDVVDGCGMDSDNVAINFGDKFGLNADFSLKGVVVSVDSGDTLSTHLSPLSHMAVAYASSGLSGLTVPNIEGAYAHIEAMMDLDDGALARAPADITNLGQYTSLTKSEIEMGVISAAFLSLVNTPDWESIDEVLTHVENQMSASGELSAVNMGSLRDVALDDLFFNANDIVDSIVQLEPESAHLDVLTVVSTETSDSYQAASELPQEVDPVQFVSHPQSTTVNEGEQVQFSVNANGGGTLVYQWRKDGEAISGATNASLTVSVAELSDIGAYDVIVSNSVGAVTSLTALLAVTEMLASVELTWDIPLEREDGSALELYEINGYVISYGTTSGNLDGSISVTGAAVTTALVEELAADTYYFAIATVDSDGVQGAYSSEISQIIM